MVDAIERPSFQFNFWQRRGCGRDECPVAFVFAAFFDPSFEQLDLLGRKMAMRIGRRHNFIRVIGGDTVDEFALGEFTRHDGVCAAFEFRA